MVQNKIDRLLDL